MLFPIIFFILGLVIGSFLNVVIYRLNTKKSFGGRSACLICQNKLAWYELVPVLSFVGLRGRCRNCKSKISLQYPLIEIFTGVLFLVLFLKFESLFNKDLLRFSMAFLFYAFIFCNFLVISAYDFRHKIIPDRLVLIFGILSFISLFFSGFSFYIPNIWDFLGGIFVASPFALLWLISGGRWMGLGDAKLALPIGWLLGLSGALSSLVLAFWLGATIGILLILLYKTRGGTNYGMKSELPFGPFLALGTFLAFLFNLNIFNF